MEHRNETITDCAQSMHRLQPEYNLAMGECKMHTGEYKEAIQYFSNVVSQRPKNISSWEALIRCLYLGEYYEEALGPGCCRYEAYREQTIICFLSHRHLYGYGKNKRGFGATGKCDAQGAKAA